MGGFMRTMGWAVSRGRTASHIRSVEYTQESPKYKEKLPLLEAWQEKLRDATTNAARFLEWARRHSEIALLRPELLRLFIEQRVVGERVQNDSRSVPQEVMIHY